MGSCLGSLWGCFGFRRCADFGSLWSSFDSFGGCLHGLWISFFGFCCFGSCLWCCVGLTCSGFAGGFFAVFVGAKVLGVKREDCLVALFTAGLPVVVLDADSVGEEEAFFVNIERFFEENFDLLAQLLEVDLCFLFGELFGAGGGHHIGVHFLVHFAHTVD